MPLNKKSSEGGKKSYQKGPDLKRYMDKKIKVSLNGNRKVVGLLRGYDAFMNIVLENASDHTKIAHSTNDNYHASDGSEHLYLGTIVLRGSSIAQFESLERVVVAPPTVAAGGVAS